MVFNFCECAGCNTIEKHTCAKKFKVDYIFWLSEVLKCEDYCWYMNENRETLGFTDFRLKRLP